MSGCACFSNNHSVGHALCCRSLDLRVVAALLWSGSHQTHLAMAGVLLACLHVLLSKKENKTKVLCHNGSLFTPEAARGPLVARLTWLSRHGVMSVVQGGSAAHACVVLSVMLSLEGCYVSGAASNHLVSASWFLAWHAGCASSQRCTARVSKISCCHQNLQ